MHEKRRNLEQITAAALRGHYIRTDVHYHHRARVAAILATGPRTISSSAAHPLSTHCVQRPSGRPPMTHLGTMLHFQLPTSSIITRPPAATDSRTEGHPIRAPVRPSVRVRSQYRVNGARQRARAHQARCAVESDPSLTVAHPIS